jgi:putative DNA primase/helicase
MLERVTSGDNATAQVLLEFMGYSISNTPCYSDKIMVMFGEGSNGKTRFLNVIRALMGEAAISLEPGDFDKDAKVRKLNGALLSVTEEMPAFAEKEFWEKIKNLASGGELTVDIKFKDAVSFPNRCKLVFTCNKLPQGTDPTHGFFRRLILVPFNHEFKQTDHDFTPDIDKLIIESELPGVFNLVWDAFKVLKLNRYRFSESGEVNKQVEDYKVGIDSVAQWVEDIELELANEYDKVGIDHFIKAIDLFSEYTEWGEKRNIRAVGYSEYIKRLNRCVKGLKERHDRARICGARESGFRGLVICGVLRKSIAV